MPEFQLTVRSIPGRLAILVAALFISVQPLAAAGVSTPQPAYKIASEGTQKVDDQFHAMFISWQKVDTARQHPAISVPSVRPVNMATFTSAYGVRSDPFRHLAAMHAGIDLAAPQGTAVYATADGTVDRADWFGGYGNCVEIDHGKGVATRFGHLSRILVHPGQLVHRGDVIALVGSTGRSTGPHLHYEVRIDGHAVNPVPFLQSADYVTAMEARSSAVLALGGPDDVD
jgi:murein DD-endopeptidase MepM/ murein hydrolase activator NlpD